MKRPPSSALWNMCSSVYKNLQSADLCLKSAVAASPRASTGQGIPYPSWKSSIPQAMNWTECVNCINCSKFHS